MKTNEPELSPPSGGCTCGNVRYRMAEQPLFVHCCHCSWCQRESGSAFAVNIMIESAYVQLTRGEVTMTMIPSNSNMGQEFARCGNCKIALWSHYGSAGRKVCFIRAGTLDKPDHCPPDIHIFTSTKMPWVQLPGNVPVVEEFYKRSAYWPEQSIARYQKALA